MKCDQKTATNPNQILHSDIADVIKEDVLSPLSLEWRKLQSADHKRWSRRYLLPLIKIACLSLGWITLIFKRLIPLQLGSEKLLNRLSCFFMEVLCVARSSGDAIPTLFSGKCVSPFYYSQLWRTRYTVANIKTNLPRAAGR